MREYAQGYRHDGYGLVILRSGDFRHLYACAQGNKFTTRMFHARVAIEGSWHEPIHASSKLCMTTAFVARKKSTSTDAKHDDLNFAVCGVVPQKHQHCR